MLELKKIQQFSSPSSRYFLFHHFRTTLPFRIASILYMS